MRVSDLKFNDLTDRTAFELPDKTKLDIGVEIFRIPEKLFLEGDHFKGLPKMLQSSI